MKVALAVTVTVAVVAALVRSTEEILSLSCEFGRDDMCGWTSVKNETNTLEWTVGRYQENSHDNGNYFAFLDIDGHDAGDQGVLASPSLQPWPPGYKCQILFQYYLEQNYCCRLSLLQEKAGITSVVWHSTRASYFHQTFRYDPDCTGGRYKLYFKGERISNQHDACGNRYNGIAVDNVGYRVVPGEPPPASLPTTATTRSTSTLTTIFNSTEQVSCRFWFNDKCKWTNEQSTQNTLSWTTAYWTNHWPLEFFARLNVAGHHTGDQGVLESPWLQPQLPGYRCRLQFQYYLEKDDGCRLSLLQRKGDTCSRLWNTTTASLFDETIVFDINCTGDLYKLYFKGERISNRTYACGDNGHNGIYVDNIVYHVDPGKPPPTSHPTTTATATTLTIFSTSMSTQVQGSSPASDALASNNTEGLSSAAVAGITIAAIVVVVVVVIAVVVIFVSRRRNGDGDRTTTWLACYFRKDKPPSASRDNVQRAVSNTGYVPDDHITTSDQGDRVGFSNPDNQNNDQVLGVVPVGQANPYETLNTDDNESRPYEILPSQASPYETLARGNRDSNAYDILFAGRQDSDGYELPVASPENNRAALQDNRNHDYNN